LGANPEDLVQKLKKSRDSKKGIRPSDIVQNKILSGKQPKKKSELEYTSEGYQNALHLIQNFPHPKVLQFLLDLNKININHQDYLNRTPLHLFTQLNDEIM